MRYALLPVACLLLAGCGTSSRATNNWDYRHHSAVPLAEQSLNRLEGSYHWVGRQHTCAPDEASDHCDWTLAYVLGEIAPEPLPEDAAPDRFVLTVRDPRHIEIAVEQDGAVVAQWTLQGKLSSRGFFALDGPTKIVGIPPLLWGMRDSDGRLDVDADGTLLVQRTTGGVGFLVVMPVGGSDAGWGGVFERADAP